jgi:spore coat polysaccharide biosynthesis predicted glycosyltransferase SpsG
MSAQTKKEPVVIRVDGSMSKGMGHIVRMLAIARGLSAGGIPVYFVMKPFEEGYAVIQEAGFPIYLIDREYENHINGTEQLKKILVSTGSRLIIHDVRATTYEYMSKLKRFGFFTVNFDDTGDGASLADVLIDPFVPEARTSRILRRFFGPKFLILRDDFAKNRQKAVRPEVKKICIMPGGTNAGRTMENLISWLKEIPGGHEITVMAGVSADSAEESLYSHHNSSVFVVRDWEQAPGIISRSDLCITSGGVSMCEACAAGVPTMSIAQVDHEIANVLMLAKDHAVVPLGRAQDLTKEYFLSAFSLVTGSPKFRQMLSDNGRKAIDGMGRRRVMRIIQSFYREIGVSQDLALKLVVN